MKRMPLDERDSLMSAVTMKVLEGSGSRHPVISAFYPMTCEQIKYLSDRGDIYFGGHTHSHTILSSAGVADAADEVIINKKRIEQVLNRPCVFFAYPNGKENDFNQNHKKILINAGYKAAFSLTQRRSMINDDPFDISRIHVAPEDTIKSLDFRFSGAGRLINH